MAELWSELVKGQGEEETISVRVYDDSGGVTYEKRGTGWVILMDNVAPELTLLGEVQVTTDQGTTYVDAGASATDTVDGDLTEKIEVSGEVDTSSSGTYTLKYDGSDAAGNAAEGGSRTQRRRVAGEQQGGEVRRG